MKEKYLSKIQNQKEVKMVNIKPNERAIFGPLILDTIPWVYTEQINNDIILYCFSENTFNYGFARELSINEFKDFLGNFLSYEIKCAEQNKPIYVYCGSKDKHSIKFKELKVVIDKVCSVHKKVHLDNLDIADSTSLYASHMHSMSDGSDIQILANNGKIQLVSLGEIYETMDSI